VDISNNKSQLTAGKWQNTRVYQIKQSVTQRFTQWCLQPKCYKWPSVYCWSREY